MSRSSVRLAGVLFVLATVASLPLSSSRALAPESGNPVLSFAGVAVVQSVGDSVVVALDETADGRPADGLIDHVFWFMGNVPLAEPISLHLPAANLETASGVLRISSVDGTLLVLTVARQGQQARPQPQRKALAESRVHIVPLGIGLAHYRGPFQRAMPGLDSGEILDLGFSLSKDGDIDFQNPGSSTNSGSCSSGGAGSTSCSLTCGGSSCGVTCASGYYSCCNCGGSCRCVYSP